MTIPLFSRRSAGPTACESPPDHELLNLRVESLRDRLIPVPPAGSHESVSTWQQPLPPPASEARTALIAGVAGEITALSARRLRVAVDGLTAAGKTSFGHELAAALRLHGRPTLRASLDDFKNPWREARELGYDRLSGEGYYRNAYDFRSARHLLLEPAGPEGTGIVALCAHDPLTGADHRAVNVAAPADAVLIVDSVFAFRPEYNDLWDYRIWLEVSAEVAVRRGIARDAGAEGVDGAARLHRDRYHAAEMLYVAEVGPIALADIVIDNEDFACPRILRRGPAYSLRCAAAGDDLARPVPDDERGGAERHEVARRHRSGHVDPPAVEPRAVG
jgi:uridine kinase